MRNLFFAIFGAVFLFTGVLSYFHPGFLWSLILTVPVFALGLYESLQTKKAILRNFPLLGN